MIIDFKHLAANNSVWMSFWQIAKWIKSMRWFTILHKSCDDNSQVFTLKLKKQTFLWDYPNMTSLGRSTSKLLNVYYNMKLFISTIMHEIQAIHRRTKNITLPQRRKVILKEQAIQKHRVSHNILQFFDFQLMK